MKFLSDLPDAFLFLFLAVLLFLLVRYWLRIRQTALELGQSGSASRPEELGAGEVRRIQFALAAGRNSSKTKSSS